MKSIVGSVMLVLFIPLRRGCQAEQVGRAGLDTTRPSRASPGG